MATAGTTRKGKTMARKRYNRADIHGTTLAALDLAESSGNDQYIHATAYGYTITNSRPPVGQSYTVCYASGGYAVMIYDFRAGCYTERPPVALD